MHLAADPAHQAVELLVRLCSLLLASAINRGLAAERRIAVPGHSVEHHTPYPFNRLQFDVIVISLGSNV